MQYYYFASTYGSGNYNNSTYNGAASQGTPTPAPTPVPAGTTNTGAAGGTTPAGSGGLLTNTGFDVILAVSLACLIISAALIIRFWRRPAMAAASAEADRNSVSSRQQ